MRMLAFALLAGCMTTQAPPPGRDAELKGMLGSGAFRTSSFRRINGAPYPSALTGATPTWVNVYADASFADGYATLTSATDDPALTVPPGATLVREVLDQTGKILKLTLMTREANGWFPGGGDFLFGVTDEHGTPLEDASGDVEWGPLDTCGSCHQQRAHQGWLFGVPQSARH
jgi:hypothetical protein